MSINETPTTPPPAAPKAAKPKRKPQRKPVAAPVKEPGSLFAGITPRDCPSACVPAKCVISGCGSCAHPHKGGLQAALQTQEALRRSNEARRILGKQKLDLTAA